jgi:hypothetical protein
MSPDSSRWSRPGATPVPGTAVRDLLAAPPCAHPRNGARHSAEDRCDLLKQVATKAHIETDTETDTEVHTEANAVPAQRSWGSVVRIILDLDSPPTKNLYIGSHP